MKKILTILLLGFCLTNQYSFAQTPNYDCVEQIRTTTPTISIWDWRTPEYQAFVRDKDDVTGRPVTILSPFYNAPFNFNANTAHLSLPLDKDYQPEDGWELVYKKLGTSTSFSQSVVAPSFALYNKYTGTLRAFSFITQAPDFVNKAVLAVQFVLDPNNALNNKESALLTHLEAIAQPVQTFKKKAVANALNAYVEEGGYWLYADIPTAYDPCTCGNKTILEIEPLLITSANIKLDINGKITQLVDSTQQPTGFQLLMKNVDGAVKAGNNAHKSSQDALDFLKKVVLQQASPQKDSIINKTDPSKSQIKDLVDLPKWIKAIPKIGAVVGVLDFFVNGGYKKPAPTTFQVNLKAEGTIQTTQDYEPAKMYTPGSDNLTEDPNLIPYYNNTLGVLNLLEPPKVEYITYKPNVSKVGFYNLSGQQLATDYTTPQIVEYKVVAPLKYALNPIAGLEIVDMEASLIVDPLIPKTILQPSCRFNVANTPCNIIPYSANKYTYGPVELTEFDTTMLTYGQRLRRDTYLEIDNWPKTDSIIVKGKTDYSLHKTIYRTPFTPLNFFSETGFRIFVYPNQTPKIFCRLKVVLKRKDKEDAPYVFLVLTYPVEPTLSPLNTPQRKYTFKYLENRDYARILYGAGFPVFKNYAISSIDASPWNLFKSAFLNDTLNLSNNNYTWQYFSNNINRTFAKRSIVIKGKIIATNPVSYNAINLTAGQDIRLLTGAVISHPNTTLKLGVPAGFTKNPPQTKAEIISFCGTKYNPVVSSFAPNDDDKAFLQKQKTDENKAQEAPENYFTQLYNASPNPATSLVTFAYELAEAGQVSLFIQNTLGENVAVLVQYQAQEAGRYEANFDTSTLPAGIYFYTLSTGSFKETKRLVVIK